MLKGKYQTTVLKTLVKINILYKDENNKEATVYILKINYYIHDRDIVILTFVKKLIIVDFSSN